MGDVNKRRATKIHVAFVTAAVVLPLFPYVIIPRLPWRLNMTQSLPLGFYRKTHGEVTKGALVAFCLPSDLAKYTKARGYVGEGKSCPEQTQLLIKPVVAGEGDVVEVRPEGVSINGVMIPRTPVFETDLRGRRHEVTYLGVHRVPPGSVAVIAADNERSFDTRYLGFVKREWIVDTMEAALTW